MYYQYNQLVHESHTQKKQANDLMSTCESF